ncbi:hypothetical protein BDY21DRAFT_323583 [Lineolata rhizophorae]|uniref:PH domain-containing protein n=1 Tax=Lineolata rhizophorae TaxID=578093 RepID=A0A6A6NVN4_9PEZI|nr:hypothetical protein BDY21DRAFT_323583 [Lineolata rhizophorae]
MADDQPQPAPPTHAPPPPPQTSLPVIPGPMNLIPVGLKEAALDSPTFRATAAHFAEQIDLLSTWLDSYAKAASKLAAEAHALEPLANAYTAFSTPPGALSEAAIDHDYTVLAMRRWGEGAREYWAGIVRGLKRVEGQVVEPVRGFLQTDVKGLKDARKLLDSTQRTYDSLLSRYLSQSKTKEASSLREDAFQLHEARKSYLRASMDFCVLAPQVRSSLDKLLVRVFADQWKELKTSRDSAAATFARCTADIDRVRGWSKELDMGDRVFKRELQLARRSIEESAEAAARPSRELDDYTVSTVPFLGSQGGPASARSPPTANGARAAEKQGWLFQRTVAGKPARHVWVRRWFFVQAGIFGWLSPREAASRGGAPGAGGVEESDKTGVLLCSIRPAVQEERRFCFEVKTKDATTLLQAETQADLTDWIAAFELAKRKALEDPAGATTATVPDTAAPDAAFAISPPIAPEFAARADHHAAAGSDDVAGPERAGTLPVPGGDDPLTSRASFDVGAGAGGESSGRERLMQKLDLHRRTATQLSGGGSGERSASSAGERGTPTGSAGGGPGAGGGIASLISASHHVLPVGPMPTPPTPASAAFPTPPQQQQQALQETRAALLGAGSMPSSSLAPATLAIPPAPTSLSRTAVVVSGERTRGGGGDGGGGTVPGGLMANLWGSANWGFPPSPGTKPSASSTSVDRAGKGSPRNASPAEGQRGSGSRPQSPFPPGASGGAQHRKSVSVAGEHEGAHPAQKPPALLHKRNQSAGAALEIMPNYYPLTLRAQDAQFHMLFPHVPRDERVVLVFRASWAPNDSQEFPGRVYVTARECYFYSHYLGLVLITGVALDAIEEVTAAPGRDCDFLFMHLREGERPVEGSAGGSSRVTIKTFLEPLRLLQRRLDFLVANANREEEDQLGVEDIIKTLVRMEDEASGSGAGGAGPSGHSPSMESWEDVDVNTPVDGLHQPGDGASRADGQGRKRADSRDVKASLRLDNSVYGGGRDGRSLGAPGGGISRNATKFRLPSHPVLYAPRGMAKLATQREFDVSAKALFHVLCGDKSAVFQLLYAERNGGGNGRDGGEGAGGSVVQTPWVVPEQAGQGYHKRQFEYEAGGDGSKGGKKVTDYQVIEVFNDHLCYVLTDRKTPWWLPREDDFVLVSKIVITHVSKLRCKLAIFVKVDWKRIPTIGQSLIDQQALADLDLDALDLADLLSSQVAKLGPNSRTRKALTIFGLIGQNQQASQLSPADLAAASASAGLLPPSSATSSPQATTPNPNKEQQLRKRRHPRSLASLFAQAAQAWLLAALANTVAALLSTGRSMVKACSAHMLLVALLATSAALNGLYGTREAREWIAERRAGALMKRLGVGVGMGAGVAGDAAAGDVLGRGVWLRDVDEVFAGNESLVAVGQGDQGAAADGSACRDSFAALLAAAAPGDDGFLHSPADPAAPGFEFEPRQRPPLAAPQTHTEREARAAAARLRATRARLAAHRYDLLVATRVLNRVEREVVRGEWEGWLWGENRRCEAVGGMLRRRLEEGKEKEEGNGTRGEGAGKGEGEKEGEGWEGVDGERLEGLVKWWGEYCGGCRRELRRVEEERGEEGGW